MLAGTAAAAWYLPAQARHHYCETGVVYTTNYLTLHLPGGVVGFPPGTRFTERFNVPSFRTRKSCPTASTRSPSIRSR